MLLTMGLLQKYRNPPLCLFYSRYSGHNHNHFFSLGDIHICIFLEFPPLAWTKNPHIGHKAFFRAPDFTNEVVRAVGHTKIIVRNLHLLVSITDVSNCKIQQDRLRCTSSVDSIAIKS